MSETDSGQELGRANHPHNPSKWTPEERIAEYGYDVLDPPMMECGHAANATWNSHEGPKPSCVICFGGPDSKGARIAEHQPSLEGRKARCAHYGSTPSGRNHSGDSCQRGQPCLCEKPSAWNLAFFEYRPNEQYDRYYCGCWGWD